MAYLQKRGKRSYRLKWRENGKYEYESFKADTEEEANRIKEKKERELERAKSSRLRLNDLWELYKKGNPRRNNKPHEEAYWKRVIEHFENCFVHEITKKSIIEWKKWLLLQPNKNFKVAKPETLSTTYVSACMKRFRTVWLYGDDIELFELKNPFKKIDYPKEHQNDIVLSWREVNKIYEIARKKNPLEAEYMMFLVDTGLRREELYKLKWSDVRPNQIILKETKSGGDESIPNWPQFQETLDKIRSLQQTESDYVYTNKNGVRLKSKETITDMANRYFKRIGIYRKGMGAHIFRHSFATLAQENGLSMMKVSQILRHSSITMTQRYTHLLQNDEDGQKANFRKDEVKLGLLEDEGNLFSDGDIEKLYEGKDGFIVSSNEHIIRVRVDDGTFFFKTPCGEAYRRSDHANEHFEDCFKCHELAGKIKMK